ncbi:unnamed protein product, partial [Protopolystoma xenopodis]
MNGGDGNNKLSLELEKDARLPFMDGPVGKEGSKLGRNVYRKDTNAGFLLNCFSTHAYGVKVAVMKAKMTRSLSLADVNHREQEERR